MKIPRVVVGMSGGVDSSVSAFLLKKRGFDVIGLHMVNWDAQEEGTSQCPRSKDESDAKSVCDRLKIPFYTVNFVKQYWNDVFLRFLENYKMGRTTVPDIDCNRSIKFDIFHKIAQEKFGADFIATGHYATTSFGDFQQNRNDSQEIRLYSCADPLKDQTFFLCTVSQEQLKRAIFPLGSLQKTEVKRIAEKEGFHAVATKPESMGICFVGKRKRFAEFLDEYIEPKPGKIVLSNGKTVGNHKGVHHFTIGKRINGQYLEERSHLGYFVSRIDAENGDVVACEGSHHPDLYATRFRIQSPDWIPIRNPLEELPDSEILCRIQRTHPPVPCTVEKCETSRFLSVIPRIPLRATAPGQMCVFYTTKNECLGGGEIVEIQDTLV
ncbi:unnamed protein product [Caenorhabditis sp. 36 PRJEB53466]|nr:unnamed protein product [Caenorhabditis sp. 36 PRJEB53466]